MAGIEMVLIDTTTNTKLTMPVPPSDITVNNGATTISFSSIISGGIDLPKGREPRVYEFVGMLPGIDMGFDVVDGKTPENVVKAIENWGEGKAPYNRKLRLIVGGTLINDVVYVDSFVPVRSKGGGTITYSLTLKEYRSFSVKVYDANKTSTTNKKRPTAPIPKTYVVKKGDNLWAITRKFLGGGARWMELFNQNKKTLRSKKPELIYPGEKLVIPKGWLK